MKSCFPFQESSFFSKMSDVIGQKEFSVRFKLLSVHLRSYEDLYSEWNAISLIFVIFYQFSLILFAYKIECRYFCPTFLAPI